MLENMEGIKHIQEEIQAQILKIEDRSLLEEVKWFLDRQNEVSAELLESIKTGTNEAKMGMGTSHNNARKVYSKWL